jgi:hypothetical protein
MTLFDLIFIGLAGYFLVNILKKVKAQQQLLAEQTRIEEELVLATRDALLAQPYYYYELVKDNLGGKQYLLYNVTDDEYVGQADTLSKLKKLAKDINPAFDNVFLKNISTNKITAI